MNQLQIILTICFGSVNVAGLLLVILRFFSERTVAYERNNDLYSSCLRLVTRIEKRLKKVENEKLLEDDTLDELKEDFGFALESVHRCKMFWPQFFRPFLYGSRLEDTRRSLDDVLDKLQKCINQPHYETNADSIQNQPTSLPLPLPDSPVQNTSEVLYLPARGRFAPKGDNSKLVTVEGMYIELFQELYCVTTSASSRKKPLRFGERIDGFVLSDNLNLSEWNETPGSTDGWGVVIPFRQVWFPPGGNERYERSGKLRLIASPKEEPQEWMSITSVGCLAKLVEITFYKNLL